MLDDLRNTATQAIDEEEQVSQDNGEGNLPPRRRPARQFMGMTPGQRFAIMLLLFMMTCVLGSFCLILTGRVVLPL